MTFTNVLEMLDLAGIPLRSSARRDGDPLIVVGGPVVFNVEPLADSSIWSSSATARRCSRVPRSLKELKRSGAPRASDDPRGAQIEGIYAPALYDVERDERRTVCSIPVADGDAPIR